MNDPRLVESVDVYEVVEVLRNADGEPILDRDGEPIWLNLPPLVLDPKRRQPENLEKSGGETVPERECRAALAIAVEAIKQMRLTIGQLGGFHPPAENGDVGYWALQKINELVPGSTEDRDA